MDWIQTLSIIATVIVSAYYIHRDIRADMQVQSARSDKLYEMFCDLQRQMKDELLTLKKEHYDFMKSERR